jgi:hypothetical protein
MTAPLGSLVYLQSVTANMHIYAVLTDNSVPNLNRITVNVAANEATALVPALMGPPGPAGEPQFVLTFQPEVFDSPSDLPDDLNNQDMGKYWLVEQVDDNGNIVSAAAYVWWGSFFRVLPFGTQGPIGPVPVVNPEVILIDPEDSSYVQNTGTVANPQWTYFLAVPKGPPGPAATLAGCPDVDETKPPTIGQVLGFNGRYNEGLPVFQPMTIGSMNPMPYTVPESSFQSYSGVASSNHTVCTFAVPANPFPWKPLVWGHIQLAGGWGVQYGHNNLVGVEVRIGDAHSGQLVATGYGNALGAVITVTPQTSEPATSANTTGASTALTPGNSIALVPANHTGNSGTLYVNLTTQGMASTIQFAPNDNQLFVLACPVTTTGAISTAVFAPFSTTVEFKAWQVTMG